MPTPRRPRHCWPAGITKQPADGQPGSPEAASSAAAAYYNAVCKHLLRLTFDELPADDQPQGSDRWFEVMRELLPRADDPYFDIVATTQVEPAEVIVSRALHEAAAELRQSQGNARELHLRHLRDRPDRMAVQPGRRRRFRRRRIVNATGWDASVGYQVNAVPSMRMIVDLNNLDASRWIALTGVSGHAFSPHYNDQFDLWRTGQLLPMPWDRPTIERAAKHTQTLTP